jgi:hypothetical protein
MNRDQCMNVRIWFCLCAFVALPSFALTTASAGPVVPSINIGNVLLHPSTSPQTGQIEVWFGTDIPESVDIAGFQVRLSLVGPDNDLSITGVTAPTAHPYVFAPQSSAPLFSVDPDGQGVTLGDFLDSGFKSIEAGKGIATLLFEVQPALSGKSYQLQVDTNPDQTFLAVDQDTFLSYTVRNGQISVVPEPTIASGLAVLFASKFFAGRRRRHRVT